MGAQQVVSETDGRQVVELLRRGHGAPMITEGSPVRAGRTQQETERRYALGRILVDTPRD